MGFPKDFPNLYQAPDPNEQDVFYYEYVTRVPYYYSEYGPPFEDNSLIGKIFLAMMLVGIATPYVVGLYLLIKYIFSD